MRNFVTHTTVSFRNQRVNKVRLQQLHSKNSLHTCINTWQQDFGRKFVPTGGVILAVYFIWREWDLFPGAGCLFGGKVDATLDGMCLRYIYIYYIYKCLGVHKYTSVCRSWFVDRRDKKPALCNPPRGGPPPQCCQVLVTEPEVALSVFF